MGLGLDVILHGNLLRWMQDHQNSSTNLFCGSEHRSDGPLPTCTVSGDIVYADKNSVSLLNSWVRLIPTFFTTQYGDQDALNVVLRDSRYQHQCVPQRLVGKCARFGELATQY